MKKQSFCDNIFLLMLPLNIRYEIFNKASDKKNAYQSAKGRAIELPENGRIFLIRMVLSTGSKTFSLSMSRLLIADDSVFSFRV